MEDNPEAQVESSSVGEAPADEGNSSKKSDFEDEEGEETSGDEEDIEDEGEEAETKKGDEGGQALVGSISHILRTLFRDLYQKPALPPSPEPPPTPATNVDPSRPGTALEAHPESDAAPPDGSEGVAGGEGDGEGEGGYEGDGKPPAEEHDGSQEQAAPQDAASAADKPAEAGEGSGEGVEANDGAENEGEDVENNGAEAGAEESAAAAALEAPPADDTAAPLPPPPPAQLTPLQQSAVRAMEAVDRRLIAQRRDASRTLEMLTKTRQAAEAADHAEENALKKQGILVNAHVPVGPSHLSETLAAARIAMEDTEAQRLQEEAGQNAPASEQQAVDESYPSVVPELVSARALMEANWKDYLYRSGNLAKPPPKPKGRSSRHGSDDEGHNNNNSDSPDEDNGGGVVDDGLGYLKMTGSLSKRKELLLTQSYGPHGALYKPEKAAKKGPEAEMDSLLRAEIDADLSANAGFVTTTAAAASPTEPEKKPKKKKKEVHGEQHDLDMKVIAGAASCEV